MDTLLAIAILIIVLWAGLSAVYLYLGRQQKSLQNDIDVIQTMLQQEDDR